MAVDAGVLPEAALLAAGSPERSLWGEALHELHRLARYRHLIKYLLSAALRFDNVGTIFGYLWWILDPLLTGLVYVILVDVMLGSGREHFTVFVFTSVVVWKSVTVSMRSAMAQTFGRQGLMKQIAFPRSVIPVVAVAAETVRFFVGLLVLLAFAAGFGLYPNATV